MNQQCRVCGEPAAGFHFGAFTCEGCKSFFGRTYNNLGSISECKNGGVCVINKKNRTACKACRLRKCIQMGMSKSSSRYGRRSNWFKIHCLLQEQNGDQSGVGPGGPFGPGCLPGFLSSQSPIQQGLYGGGGGGGIGKDGGGKDRTSPSSEDFALQTQLLRVAMLKQERERGDKSPHPDDIALQNHLNLLAWQKERERAGRHPPSGTPPPSFGGYKHPAATSPIFPVNFARKDPSSSPPEVFRPFLSTYKRTADTPSDSGASSVDGDHGDESRSNSALSCFKASSSPPLSEREFPPRKINATVTLTTTATTTASGYHPHPGIALGLLYPPPGLITPAASQHSPRGGDLLLVSPSPGGLAVEQDEPIDLSVRSSRSSPRTSPSGAANEATGDEDEGNPSTDSDVDDATKEDAATTKSKPLDLTLGVKRPMGLPLSL